MVSFHDISQFVTDHPDYWPASDQMMDDCVTHQITNSMEQSPSSEAHGFTASEIPPFYGTQRFITMFTVARHLTLSWTRWVPSTPSNLLVPWELF
jgi:hypothetical protein